MNGNLWKVHIYIYSYQLIDFQLILSGISFFFYLFIDRILIASQLHVLFMSANYTLITDLCMKSGFTKCNLPIISIVNKSNVTRAFEYVSYMDYNGRLIHNTNWNRHFIYCSIEFIFSSSFSCFWMIDANDCFQFFPFPYGSINEWLV